MIGLDLREGVSQLVGLHLIIGLHFGDGSMVWGALLRVRFDLCCICMFGVLGWNDHDGYEGW